MSRPKRRRLVQFTPEQEKQFNQVTVPGTNTNSNVTVGENARKTGVQTQNFQAQEAARKDAEIQARSARKTVKRQTTLDERLRGEHGYSSYMGGETPMSGRDPLLGTIFDWTVGAKGIDTLGKTALWNYAKYAPKTMLGNWGKGYFANQALKEGIKDFGRNLSNRLYIENAGKYTLFNQFGDDIGTLLTNKPLTSEAKGRGIAMVASKNGGHKVSEDLYNIAVQDSKELGYQGLESGHDLFRPNLTMHVTDKFPKIERPNVSLQYIDGKYQFAPSSTQPPIRLLIGTTERPQPNFIQELTNHRIDLGALRNQERIRFNEATGNFEEIPMVSAPEPSTSLKFFERPTRLSPQELAGATRGERNFTPRWHVAKYPGYQLKGLMGGNPLEKQISKNGTISVNQLNAYFNKASQIEREVANKVLAEQFAGQKTIDYNQFKKAVQDELVTYNVSPSQKYGSYGINRLDFDSPDTDLGIQRILLKKYPERFSSMKNDQDVIDRALGTEYFVDRQQGMGWHSNSKFPQEIRDEYMSLISSSGEQYPKVSVNLFSSPQIPKGNATHYDANTLGHSRTMVTPENPQTLYILESQSDWAQKPLGLTKAEKHALQYIDEQLKTETPTGFSSLEELQAKKNYILSTAAERTQGNSYQAQHLHDNYLQRQLQENLRYAAENRQTRMRYPTSETAAKIEGYKPKTGWFRWFTPEGQELDPLTSAQFNPVTGNFEAPAGTIFKPMYSPEHQTILKKYADFPKLFQKLYKGQEVRTVTDAKGNTWYEVDVPKGYLSREWQFKRGGKITINNIEI